MAAPAAIAAPASIHDACCSGDAAAVQRLLEDDPEAAWQLDEYARLPLHLAAYYGHTAVVRLLLEAAPEAAMAEDVDGMLPLHWAACEGHEAAVRLLLEAVPAAAAVEDIRNRIPLKLALDQGHIAIARTLLGAGPAAAALTALAAAGEPALPLFADFLLAPGRLPLAAADWALVPTPCPGIERTLPAALACSPDQAAQVVRRMSPANKACLRTSALCVSRCGVPGAVAALILAHAP